MAGSENEGSGAQWLAVFCGSGDYKIAHIYNTGVSEKGFKLLENRFYRAENLEKPVEKLQKDGFNEYAKRLTELLDVGAGPKSKENIRKTTSIYRNNFEQIIPLYPVREELI